MQDRDSISFPIKIVRIVLNVQYETIGVLKAKE
jgi:hypothetical protein